MQVLAPLLPSAYAAAAIAGLLAANALITPPDRAPRAVAATAPPVVAALEPTQGALVGGETVTITGSGLTAVTSVEIDGVAADLDRVVNGSITLRVPNAADYEAGTVEVEVFAGDAAVASDLEWTYVTTTAVDRQLEYAFRHWDDYNTAYFGNFNEWGGDCMNFVSQTLVARGWVPQAEWFNDAQQEWADPFVHVPSFDEWLAEHPEYGAVRLDYSERDRAKVGDVIVFDWDGDGSLDHSQVISRISDDAGIEMVGHNVNSTYRSVDEAFDQQGTDSTQVYIWSIA
ncbi:hypothetical protein HDC94_000276 [Leifsonia sp. AK011]|uniref:amidase domain-containing protein n=1 Tax=Leifsonia sp. AK011 TaxID=2723075 RepID=UPI0015C8CDAA|nr:amidase domain-containing protein [Leifsonia sp. AK011]NYF09120.1 hypothetical protein [Leifsonia sp. AK011]